MFTGIIQRKGVLKEIHRRNGNTLSFTINCGSWEPELVLGESIAVDGVCLTVTETKAESFVCDLLAETLQKTTLGEAKIGQFFNLERALQMGSLIGGHFITGHIDGIGTIINKRLIASDWELTIKVPSELSKYIVPKGSIAVDGISLTVVKVEEDIFTVHLIPHTCFVTTLSDKKVGMQVNIENDIIAKYVEKILACRMENKRISIEDLRNAGF